MSIILIGFMGAGKSTIAKRLGKEVVDLDQLIESRIGMPIADFFAEFSELEFRKVENEIFQEVIEKDWIIATGGGIVENEKNRTALAAHSQVVYLTSDFDTLWQRIINDDLSNRPLAQDKTKAKDLFEQRQKYYEAVADLVVEVAQKSPEEIVAEIQNKWRNE